MQTSVISYLKLVDYTIRIYCPRLPFPFSRTDKETISATGNATIAGNTGLDTWNNAQFLYIYCIIFVLTATFSIAKMQLLYLTCLNSSTDIHKSLFAAILRAPMRFFEVNSSGEY
jgi:ABC-type multidrug transport system fused ATPase/permease subunit